MRNLSVGEERGGNCDEEMKVSLTTGFMTAAVIAYSLWQSAAVVEFKPGQTCDSDISKRETKEIETQEVQTTYLPRKSNSPSN